MRWSCSRIALGFFGFAWMAAAGAQTPTLQYVEPVALTIAGDAPDSMPTAAASRSRSPTTGGCCRSSPPSARANCRSYNLLRGSLAGRRVPGCGSPKLPRASKAPSGTAGALRGHYATNGSPRSRARRSTPRPTSRSCTACRTRAMRCHGTSARWCRGGRCRRAPTALEQYNGRRGELKAAVARAAITRQVEISLIARYGLPGGGVRRSHRRDAGAAQHRRGHLQRAGRAAGARHRRAADGAGRGSVHEHQGHEAARAARRLPHGDGGGARTRRRASDHGQGPGWHHRRHRLHGLGVRRANAASRSASRSFRHDDLGADHGARARAQLRCPARRRNRHGLRGRRRRLHHGARGQRLSTFLPVQRRHHAAGDRGGELRHAGANTRTSASPRPCPDRGGRGRHAVSRCRSSCARTGTRTRGRRRRDRDAAREPASLSIDSASEHGSAAARSRGSRRAARSATSRRASGRRSK